MVLVGNADQTPVRPRLDSRELVVLRLTIDNTEGKTFIVSV